MPEDRSEQGAPAEAPTWRRAFSGLFALLILRLLLHAFFLPVFEGPDEPFHLARAAAFADLPLQQAWRGTWVPGEIVAAIRAHPGGPDLAGAFGCPEFQGHGAAFNILDRPSPRPGAQAVRNYEAHQPPLYYLLSGSLLRLALHLPEPLRPLAPEHRLLFLRVLGVLLVAIALAGPLRRLTAGWPPAPRLAALLLLFAPGAAESLARCANDPGVFLWCTLVLWALTRDWRTPWIALLLAAGPLIKLTALPVVLVAVLWLWKRRGLLPALVAGAAAALVLPLQWLRGWGWGGTVEMNVPPIPLSEPLGGMAVGLARSLYTWVKTFFWLGGWSFFRPPVWLIVVCGLLLVVALASCRRRIPAANLLPHGAAAAAALGGFVLFAVRQRMLFGVWGGVGGWYVWGWYPWMILAAADLCRCRERMVAPLLAALAALLLAANLLWFITACRIYGF